MKVKITTVKSKGDFDKELVIMEVLEDCDIGHYMLLDNSYSGNGNVSNKVRHSYWFPDKKVKKGDRITLWTKSGTNTEVKTDNGTPRHRFYWNLKEAVWNDDGDKAVLLEIATWQIFPVAAVS